MWIQKLWFLTVNTIIFLQRLNEVKLSEIFDELKYQDKEETHWKQLKSEGKDKEGLLEAKLKNKLNGKKKILKMFCV